MSLTGQLLRKLRNEHNYTMQYIADMLSISKAAVSKWENGNEISREKISEKVHVATIVMSTEEEKPAETDKQ